LSCPPAGTPRRPHQYVPPLDVYAFFLDLEIGRGTQEDVNQFDPLVRTYQAWVQTNLGFSIGTDASIESHRPRDFMPAFNAYVHGLTQLPQSDPCYRPATVAIEDPSVGL